MISVWSQAITCNSFYLPPMKTCSIQWKAVFIEKLYKTLKVLHIYISHVSMKYDYYTIMVRYLWHVSLMKLVQV